MEIKKVKFDGVETQVSYTTEIGSTVAETTVKCDEERDPEFTKKADELIPHVCKLLEFPLHWGTNDDMTVRGISFSENDIQGVGVVITLLKKFPQFNAPLVINTPHINQEKGLPDHVGLILAKLKDHALSFLDGKRAQTDMFSKEN